MNEPGWVPINFIYGHWNLNSHNLHMPGNIILLLIFFQPFKNAKTIMSLLQLDLVHRPQFADSWSMYKWNTVSHETPILFNHFQILLTLKGDFCTFSTCISDGGFAGHHQITPLQSLQPLWGLILPPIQFPLYPGMRISDTGAKTIT